MNDTRGENEICRNIEFKRLIHALIFTNLLYLLLSMRQVLQREQLEHPTQKHLRQRDLTQIPAVLVCAVRLCRVR